MDNLTTESRYVLFSIYAMYLKQRKEGIAEKLITSKNKG